MDYQTLPELAQMQALEAAVQLLFHGALLMVAITVGCIAGLMLSTVRPLRRPAPGVPKASDDRRSRRWRGHAVRQGEARASQTRTTAPPLLREF